MSDHGKLEALESMRNLNEKGLDVVYGYERDDIVLVVLSSWSEEFGLKYHCYRYFTIGHSWVLSRDHQDANDGLAFKWIVGFVKGM